MKRLLIVILSAFTASLSINAQITGYVDPRIGSTGLGRTVIAPACPFGMVKPSPDCTVSPNSGWRAMPARVDGFGQIHVSGTGGGPKYGNILISPFSGELEGRRHISYRKSEDISLGRYECEFEESGIKTEITTAEKASYYRFTYPDGTRPALGVDAGFFLGESATPNAREAQQFEDSFAEAVSDHEIHGWSRISGGWNNGAPYTVYFHIVSDTPFSETAHWEENGREGVLAGFAKPGTVNVKVGISFLSMEKAKRNADEQITGWSFEEVYNECLAKWEKVLGRFEVKGTETQKKMFYTALYHTMLMPVDRKGEWEKCGPDEDYYDDYYAIWDTYRTSTPLLTLLDPQREVGIVNSLVNIYKHDGFLPDARSGNSNGRTQGGSNAEIVIADAFVKGLEGIDYELALEAMINDAEKVPADDEAEGRGGLEGYNTYGFVPWGIDRAGNRTVEYATCDYAIYTVAKGLGHEEIAQKYLKRSNNWKNLWRADFECDGVRGFILPRAADGQWLDELPFGHSSINHPTYRYGTMTFEGPWYTKWWSAFFYEASSWEYSLSVPHDVPGLIEACGGKDAFEKRLDRFFEGGYYNVNNEPSFLTPCLYHWVDRPDKTSARVLQIVADNFNETSQGLPGNDDSGAMSSWLAFHMMGFYPIAGSDVYAVHTPLLKRTTYNLPGGGKFRIVARGLSAKRNRIASIRLNGRKHDSFFLTHGELMKGGKLVLKMRRGLPAAVSGVVETKPLDPGAPAAVKDTLQFSFALHGQSRRFTVRYDMAGDSLRFHWQIERNLRMWHGCYTMTPEALQSAGRLSTLMPEDGNFLVLEDELFCMISRDAYDSVKATGRCDFNGTTFRFAGIEGEALGHPLLHLVDVREGAEIWVLDLPQMPFIWKMTGNPLEQDWTCTPARRS